MRKLTIGDRVITDDNVFVIAEIGSNHGGDPDLCEKMIIEAAKCGVDAVKLQKRDNSIMFTKEALNRPYDNEFSYGKTYGEHRQHLDWFGKTEFVWMQDTAIKHGVLFFATPFEEASADFLYEIGMPIWKIASCDVTNLPLVKKVAGYGQPVIISVGGASMDAIKAMVDTIGPINSNFAILHCVSVYPNEDFQLNLNFIETLRTMYSDNIIGFSSHSPGQDTIKDAIGVGARIIEAHFTLNRGSRGTDHGFSLEPKGMSDICEYWKRRKLRLGSSIRHVYPEEKCGFIKKFGKAIHAARHIPAGKVIESSDLTIKSPADGLPPGEFDKIIGRVTLFDLSTDSGLSWGDFV